jgi:hypothetical protein
MWVAAGDSTVRRISRSAGPTPSNSLVPLEQHRGDVHLELVQQPGPQVLLDDLGPTAHGHVPAGGGLPGLLQGRLDPVGDEGEGGPLQDQRLTGMVGEDEHRVVVRRLLPPQPRQDSSQGPSPPLNIRRPMMVARRGRPSPP